MPLTPNQLNKAVDAIANSNRGWQRARDELQGLVRELKASRIGKDQYDTLITKLEAIRKPDSRIAGNVRQLIADLKEAKRKADEQEAALARGTPSGGYATPKDEKGPNDGTSGPQRVSL